MNRTSESRKGEAIKHPAIIETLLLDADGVLQTSHEDFLPSVTALCPNPSLQKEFLNDVFLAEKPCLTGHVDFPTELEAVLAKWHIDIPVSKALKLWHQIEPVPEILTAISKLRRQGVCVCLASNQQSHRAQIMSENLGYAALFDKLFFSYQLGIAKPRTTYFEAILDRLDTKGETTLFLDDHPENVDGAKNVGILGEVYHVRDGNSQFTSIMRRYNLYFD